MAPWRRISPSPTSAKAFNLVGWNASIEQGLGLIARANDLGLGTSNAYYLHYNTNIGSSQSGLVLERDDGEFPNASAFTPVSPLDPSVGYRLVFTGVGAELTGQIFALGDLIDPLATVTLTDATYQSGFAGVLTTGLIGGDNTGVDTTFDNFSAQSVPEPSSLVLASLAVGGLVLASAARHRRARA